VLVALPLGPVATSVYVCVWPSHASGKKLSCAPFANVAKIPGPSIASVTLVAPDVVHLSSTMVGALHDSGFDAPTVAKPEIFTDDELVDDFVVVVVGTVVAVDVDVVLVDVDLVGTEAVVVVVVAVLCFEPLLQAVSSNAADATLRRTRIRAS